MSHLLRSIPLALVAVISAAAPALARPTLLLSIPSDRFYPGVGYASTIGDQELPSGYAKLIFATDSRGPFAGKLTIRCRGDGREYRDVILRPSGAIAARSAGEVNNPCSSGSHVNFDLYVSSPVLGTGSRDAVLVYGDDRAGPGPVPGPGGDRFHQLKSIASNRFSRMGDDHWIRGVDLSSGYRDFYFTVERGERERAPRGVVAIRCRERFGPNRLFRNLALRAEPGWRFTEWPAARLDNPCRITADVEMDIFISRPEMNAGSGRHLVIHGRR